MKNLISQPKAQRCQVCDKISKLIAGFLGLCVDCIRTERRKAMDLAQEAHRRARAEFQLPEKPPKTPGGLTCKLCVNQCQMGEDEWGYCGLRVNKGGKLESLTSMDQAIVDWYYDPLPTNCVADWVCPGGTGAGFPQFAYCQGPEYGYKNLAVFYGTCSFDCLFCQNWHYRSLLSSKRTRGIQELVNAVDRQTACICYFGGDPTPQLPHALKASQLAIEAAGDRILRICWETNGSMTFNLLKKMVDLSFQTGGSVKFDLKAWSEPLNIALTGVTNQRTLQNFKYLAERSKERAMPPLAVASTLLVPGYVDAEEVSAIAKFIASINPEIPYSLLGFHPQFYMTDLPTTSRRHAQECLQAAQSAGLKYVKIGNLHLLGDSY